MPSPSLSSYKFSYDEIFSVLTKHDDTCHNHGINILQLKQLLPFLSALPIQKLHQILEEDPLSRFILFPLNDYQIEGFCIFPWKNILEMNQIEFYVEVIICLLRLKKRTDHDHATMTGLECENYLQNRYGGNHFHSKAFLSEFHRRIRCIEAGKRIEISNRHGNPKEYIFTAILADEA